MKQQVSGPVAVVVILITLLALAAAFHKAELAPPEIPEPQRPPQPQVREEEAAEIRRGLAPLGIVAVMAPLVEDRGKGVRVAWVTPSSPAAGAGIQVGDRIEQFNGIKLLHPSALVAALEKVEAGKSNEVMILRSGKTLTLAVTGITPIPPEERVKF